MCGKLGAALGADSLSYILITHAHYDHAGGAMRAKAIHPEAKLVCNGITADIFARPGALRLMRELDKAAAAEAAAAGRMPDAQSRAETPTSQPGTSTAAAPSETPSGDLLDAFSADLTFAFDSGITSREIAPGITAIATPGHTRDSSSYYFDDLGLLIATESTGFFTGTDIIPTFITSYAQALEAAENIRELAPVFILSPHHGVVSGTDAKTFPAKSKEASERFADFVMKRHRAGKTKAEIIEDYLDEYYYRVIYRTGKQPLAAMLANVEAMIPRLIAELE
jgi:glyoxylase-like metal-dependent hydrolase (beta-lactamase superfamily II)